MISAKRPQLQKVFGQGLRGTQVRAFGYFALGSERSPLVVTCRSAVAFLHFCFFLFGRHKGQSFLLRDSILGTWDPAWQLRREDEKSADEAGLRRVLEKEEAMLR